MTRLPSLRLLALPLVFALGAAVHPLFATAQDASDLRVVAAPATPPSLEPLLATLAEDRLFRDAVVGLQVVDLETGAEVFARNAEQAMVPASTMKVVTSAAALKHLGPSYRWKTALLTGADTERDPKGLLKGDLYVRGSGDPTLVVERLWKLVYDLKLEGITEIEGNVVFDRSFMDSEYVLPGWDKKADLEDGPSYFPTLGALSLNFNAAALLVGPGEEVGGPARALLETPAAGVVTIENKLITTAKGSRRNVKLEREVQEGGKMLLKLSGTVPMGSDVDRYYRAVPDPTAHFTAAFAELMKQHGIKVKGKWIDGEAPDKTRELVSLRSDPLAVVLMDTNKYSNNFMAEQVLRTLGAEVKGGPGTTAKGVEVVSEYLSGLGIPREQVTLVNGSGLSRGMRLRPSHLNRVLVDMAQDAKVSYEFMSSLAIGGRDGTLWARFRGEDEVDRLRGKTGTLEGVHCLSGYVEGADGRMYAFTFLVNELPYSIARARKVQDDFVELMFGADASALAAAP